MRWYTKLLIILMACSLFSGCGKENAYPTPLTDDLLAQFPQADAPTLPDRVLAKTDTYTYHRKDGQCYLDLGEDNYKLDLYTGGCVIPGTWLSFDSVAQMHNFLSTGRFSKEDIQTIRYGFPVDPELGFSIADPDNLYTLHLPSSLELFSIFLQGRSYTFRIRESSGADGDFSGTLNLLSREGFEQQLEAYMRYENEDISYDITRSEDSQRHAVCYDYSAQSGKRRVVQYSVENDHGLLLVEEHYWLERYFDGYSSLTVPLEIHVIGSYDGILFELNIYSIQNIPTAQFLEAFRLEPYTG